MNISLSFVQLLFGFLCILFSVAFGVHYLEGGLNWINLAVGLLGGTLLAIVFYGIDGIFKRYHLRSFNVAILGLFLGYFLSQGILSILNGILVTDIYAQSWMPLRFFIFLSCSYLGLVMTLRASEEIQASIPFFELKQSNQKKKDLLADLSIFLDSRIIDLASTGLLDNRLVIPHFSIKELHIQTENSDEMVKNKAKRSLEVIKKLEALPNLELHYVDTDFFEIKDPMMKLIRLARYLDAHIITSNVNRIQQSSVEGIRIINIHMLSNTPKQVAQAGEVISIKIQRNGKEALQGIGYLDDGTMVVVNGGAGFINKTIKVHVLSEKYTSSGRMIFSNAIEEENLNTPDFLSYSHELESNKNYVLQ